ncbi:hypothetical protein [Hymenobacter volaticus]|uniref:Uncharacterized protein n=1 Tax=Hymenobacter volaticus TaxID=2932254 RepID=A0ABY4GER1_9BACT|nr:hypothetical protein [Hymenobacter volaticus]UOQ69405.1 hypothetical protein MUN86_27335 [Hymenobacter volaticus]
MFNPEPFAWWALYLNLCLNLFGLLVIDVCNVLHWYCAAIAYYLYSALLLGVPLFVLTLWGLLRAPLLAQATPRRGTTDACFS